MTNSNRDKLINALIATCIAIICLVFGILSANQYTDKSIESAKSYTDQKIMEHSISDSVMINTMINYQLIIIHKLDSVNQINK